MGKSKELAELGQVVTQSGGNVGIGTASPNSDLHITSDGPTINLHSDTGNYAQLGFTNSGGTSVQGFIKYVHDGDYAGSMQFRVSGSERMRIDTAGRVTMPHQPAFYAYPSVGNWVNSINVLAFGTGGFWDANYNPSLYRFTAPVTGKYLLSSGILISGVGSHTWLRINGNLITNFGHTGASNANEYNYQTASVVYSLSAGDFVDVWQQAAYTSGSGIYMGGSYSYFSGYLIG